MANRFSDKRGASHATLAEAQRANAQYEQSDAQKLLAKMAVEQAAANRANQEKQDKQNWEQSRAAERQEYRQNEQAREQRQRDEQRFELEQQQADDQRRYQDEMADRERELVSAERDKALAEQERTLAANDFIDYQKTLLFLKDSDPEARFDYFFSLNESAIYDAFYARTNNDVMNEPDVISQSDALTKLEQGLAPFFLRRSEYLETLKHTAGGYKVTPAQLNALLTECNHRVFNESGHDDALQYLGLLGLFALLFFLSLFPALFIEAALGRNKDNSHILENMCTISVGLTLIPIAIYICRHFLKRMRGHEDIIQRITYEKQTYTSSLNALNNSVEECKNSISATISAAQNLTQLTCASVDANAGGYDWSPFVIETCCNIIDADFHGRAIPSKLRINWSDLSGEMILQKAMPLLEKARNDLKGHLVWKYESILNIYREAIKIQSNEQRDAGPTYDEFVKQLEETTRIFKRNILISVCVALLLICVALYARNVAKARAEVAKQAVQSHAVQAQMEALEQAEEEAIKKTPSGFQFVKGEPGRQSFYISKYELTWGKWATVRAWATRHGYDLENLGDGQADNYPVCSVSCYDAVTWCNAASEMEGLTPVYMEGETILRTSDKLPEGELKATPWKNQHFRYFPGVNENANGYRLPTTEEWDWAEHGGALSKTYMYSGSNILSNVAWFIENSGGKSHPVGRLAANELGIYDMSGNVSEWCGSFDEKTRGRVIRGGSYFENENSLLGESGEYPWTTKGHIGFRLVRNSTQ